MADERATTAMLRNALEALDPQKKGTIDAERLVTLLSTDYGNGKALSETDARKAIKSVVLDLKDADGMSPIVHEELIGIWADAFAKSDGCRVLVEDCLKDFKGSVWLPESPGFADAVAEARRNNNCAPTAPALVVRPVDVEDVSVAVRCAAVGERRKVWRGRAPLTVCGGGHSEVCVSDGGMVIVMSKLDEVHVDPKARLVTIGAGASLGAVGDAAAMHELAVPTGTWSTVGIGSILGGGIGFLTRLMGVSADNVVGAELVLPDGSLRQLGHLAKEIAYASPAEGTTDDDELLWGLRGAGSQFGVVTRLVLRATTEASSARFGRGVQPLLGEQAHAFGGPPPPERAVKEAEQRLLACDGSLRALTHKQSCNVMIGWAPPQAGEPDALMLGAFYCVLSGADRIPPEVSAPLGFQDSMQTSAPYWPHPTYDLMPPSPTTSGGVEEKAPLQSSGEVFSYVRQIFVDELGEPGARVLIQAALHMPSRMSTVSLQHCGGAARKPRPTSCFGCRSAEFSVLFMALWDDPSPAARQINMAWANRAWDSVFNKGLATGAYPVDIDAARRPHAAAKEVALQFGDKLPRLKALKQRVDPDRLFRGSWPL